MKRALVLSLFVMLGVGFASSAQLQGEWDTWLKLDISPTFGLNSFYSFLDIQYLTCGWTLEAAALIDDVDGLSHLWFEAYGSLGAFSMWSLAYFDPTTPAFLSFENAAEVSIAGVDLYALFAIQAVGEGFGTGFALGGIGTVGDCRFGVEVTWNLYSYLGYIFDYGLGVVTDWTYLDCGMWNPVWTIGALGVVQSGCDVIFSSITAIAQFPICCADVEVEVAFTCLGFDYLSFTVLGIDIGLDWLKVSKLAITYTLEEKAAAIYFSVVTGDVVCFKPYFSVLYGSGTDEDTVIDGIRLNALTLSCTLGGCEFYWGHIFAPTWTYHFGATGLSLLSSSYADCWWVVDGLYPNEMFGIQCDEDSCCGGLFSFGVNNFFSTTDSDATGIFGWMGTYAELTVGVGSNISLVGAMNLTELNGVEWIAFGVEVAW